MTLSWCPDHWVLEDTGRFVSNATYVFLKLPPCRLKLDISHETNGESANWYISWSYHTFRNRQNLVTWWWTMENHYQKSNSYQRYHRFSYIMYMWNSRLIGIPILCGEDQREQSKHWRSCVPRHHTWLMKASAELWNMIGVAVLCYMIVVIIRTVIYGILWKQSISDAFLRCLLNKY